MSKKIVKTFFVSLLITFFSFIFFLANPIQANPGSDISFSSISLLQFNPENWKAPTLDASVILSKDGRYVVFSSDNSNLVAGDTNGFSDVFLYDRETDQIELISVANDGTQGNGKSDVTGSSPISADGRFIVYASSASNLVPNDTNGYANFTDVFVYDRETKTVERANLTSNGEQEDKFDSGYPPINGNPGIGGGGSKSVSISADGRYVAFNSYAQNLSESIPHSTSPVVNRIFLRDRINHTTKMLTSARTGLIKMSADGQTILLGSKSNLVPEDTNNANDIYLYNVLNDTLELVSVGTGGVVGQAPFTPTSFSATMSDDGRYVAFYSYATNFDPQESYYNSRLDVFVHDRVLNITRPVTSGGNSHSSRPKISPDGRYVAYMSWATNLVDTATNGQMEVYITDLQTGQTELISVSIDGIPGDGYSNIFQLYAKNNDLFVLFRSPSTNLVPNDTDSHRDWYITEVSTFANHPPTASAGPDLTGSEAEELVFNGTGSTDPNGAADIVSYEWNFGDGNFGTGVTASHTYSDSGIYTASLTVTDSYDESNTDSAQINILTPAESTQAVGTDIQNIITANPGTPLSDKLDDALAKVNTAIYEIGNGNNDLAAGLGGIEGAVGDIQAAVDAGYLDQAIGRQLIGNLTAVARQLAVDAIYQAVAMNGDPLIISEAQQYLADGDVYTEQYLYKDAVNKYKDALSKAESVI